jgi:hypothetical protein
MVIKIQDIRKSALYRVTNSCGHISFIYKAKQSTELDPEDGGTTLLPKRR